MREHNELIRRINKINKRLHKRERRLTTRKESLPYSCVTRTCATHMRSHTSLMQQNSHLAPKARNSKTSHQNFPSIQTNAVALPPLQTKLSDVEACTVKTACGRPAGDAVSWRASGVQRRDAVGGWRVAGGGWRVAGGARTEQEQDRDATR